MVNVVQKNRKEKVFDIFGYLPGLSLDIPLRAQIYFLKIKS